MTSLENCVSIIEAGWTSDEGVEHQAPELLIWVPFMTWEHMLNRTWGKLLLKVTGYHFFFLLPIQFFLMLKVTNCQFD